MLVLLSFKNNHVSFYLETIIYHIVEKATSKELYFSFVNSLVLYLLIFMSM